MVTRTFARKLLNRGLSPIAAEHDVVDEAANQAFEFQLVAIGDRRADDDVVLACKRSSAPSRPPAASCRASPRSARQRLSPRHRHFHRSNAGADRGAKTRRTRTVERQLEDRWCPSQFTSVREMAGQCPGLQLFAFPRGVVHRPHGQRPGRLSSGNERVVDEPQLTDEDVGRPAVCDDVMQTERQPVLSGASVMSRQPKSGAARQTERTADEGETPLPPRPLRSGGMALTSSNSTGAAMFSAMSTAGAPITLTNACSQTVRAAEQAR